MTIEKGDDVKFIKRVSTGGGGTKQVWYVTEGTTGRVLADRGNGYYEVRTLATNIQTGETAGKVMVASSLVLKVVAKQRQLAVEGDAV